MKECDNMPNISSHMAIAVKVSERLNITSDDFIIGNLLPDLEEDKVKSHYKIQGKFYLIPDINYVVKNLDLNNKTNLGILTHLLLDKYYLEEYLYKNVPNIDVFKSKIVYKDYDILNKDIIKQFNLNIENIIKILSKINNIEYKEKLNKNINYLLLNETGTTTYLDKDKFIRFLDDISIRISEEIVDILEKK